MSLSIMKRLMSKSQSPCADERLTSGRTTATMSQSDGAQKGGSAGVKRTPGALQPTLTVRSVLPNPTKCLIDNSEIEGYDEILVG